MHYDLDQRAASLSVGEFSDFTLGPRDATGAPSGLWRAQLGSHWHNQLRAQTASENPDAQFEVPVSGQIFHRGWTITLTGRIDQLIPATKNTPLILREIKTTSRPIPADESELRAEYPAYFAQLATYAALRRLARDQARNDRSDQTDRTDRTDQPDPPTPPDPPDRPDSARAAGVRAELHFVEIASGLSQTVTLTAADDVLCHAQLERVTEFLNLRHRARERLRNLRFRPPFATLRPGQETTGRDLAAALDAHPVVFFEAPTGFGKTGVILELALAHMRAGRFDRLIYLTGKATGQLQVMRTLGDMFSVSSVQFSVETPPREPAAHAAASPAENRKLKTENSSAPAAAWLMRPKREHCICETFHCSRDVCPYLQNLETRWPGSGLSRFYLLENHPRDIDTLRAAGRDARVCPYEISRAALPFNDVWIGDYNYIFSPANRGIFIEQPGHDPARTLLVIDEAHNLPSRVADVFSHAFHAAAAFAAGSWLDAARAPSALRKAWGQWEHFLSTLKYSAAHTPATGDDARELVETLSRLITAAPLDYAQIPPETSETLWAIPEFAAALAALDLPRLWWSPQNAQLVITCLDAAQAIGPVLREFGAVILASATLTPVDNFAAACGLDEEIHQSEISNFKSQIPIHQSEIPNLKSQIPKKSQISNPEIPNPESAREREARAGGPQAPNSQSAIRNPQSAFPNPKSEKLGALTKRDTKKLFAQLTTASSLLALDEARAAAAPVCIRATTPWRDAAHDIAIDTRVDTTYRQRAHHAETTAATIAALAAAAPAGSAAVYFPSYAYAETIKNILEAGYGAGYGNAVHQNGSLIAHSAPFLNPHSEHSVFCNPQSEIRNPQFEIRIHMQPRLSGLAAQNEWLLAALDAPGVIFFVLGGSFAEGIDLLGGRITRAMVVGPALPEVNPVQNARLAAYAPLGRAGAARRVYQIPGIQKVNQALGRLVRAPGQRAKILLHCRRFAEKSYLDLLAPEYRAARRITDDAQLMDWLEREN